MNLAEVREKYPQYKDVPDDKLADGLYNKYYANKLSRDEFNKKIGFIISQNVNLINFKYQTLIITDFFINPKFRELKVADILYQELEQKAKENEFNEISVMCNINSTTTQNFYLKNKFKYNKKNYVKQI